MALDFGAEQESTTTESTGTVKELFLGLLWLGTSMLTAHASLTGDTDGPQGALGAAAAALPGVIAATLLTGASIGHAASSRFRSALGRLLAGLGVGTLFGVAAAVALRLAYGTTPSIMVLALTVGAASVAGGAIAILPSSVLEAGLWATTWVFFAGVIFGVWQATWLTKTPFGDPDKAASTWFVLAQSVFTGFLAGVYSARNLRNEKPGFGWFLAGGAVPGVILLVAEAFSRIGGASLAKLVSGFSTKDPILIKLSDAAALRHALIVLAVGVGVAAIYAVRAARESDD